MAQTIEHMIVAALERTGLGLTEFCAVHGLNARTIYRWRQGDFAAPQMRLVIKVAKALGVSYDVLHAALEQARA